ncbi:nucleoside triphosphate pyrophosphohydrolase [Pseudohaliea rubra]|uniref:Nucleoside triphosphate pyrophosphohydrolase MazG n=1 Tax=Pseudohaliea rubra DSM 19751 TaxID=1265313 RepID=A0A095VP12_9GAMM|nr:nucleoside triphosphate pyrophosphohydrolase [Pseudohaliea rubra]KGE02863.1 Nucleoside triphosphate pyrophosphohydrolase MazG [Pseudohaliea rubra DSM 19751]
MPDQDCYGLDDLLRIMERLRDPETGCPWDLKQDFQSIVPSTIEECYELADAIEQGDFDHVAEELGDVLFQVVFYGQLGREAGLFDFPGIVHTLADKLVRRHPHVFAAGAIEGVMRGDLDEQQVKAQWEAIKADERRARDQGHVLADVPRALPALPRAQKLQKRAARVGFDWENPAGVFAKLDEELAELRAAVTAGEGAAISEEVGDLLFTCVNLARQLKVDSETALRGANAKFEARIRAMEEAVQAEGGRLENLDAQALEQRWAAAKATLASTKGG